MRKPPHLRYGLLRACSARPLAAVTGGFALASKRHVSDPQAMVVAGLMIGNR